MSEGIPSLIDLGYSLKMRTSENRTTEIRRSQGPGVFRPYLKTSLHSHSTFAPLNNNVNSFNKKGDKMQLCFRYRQKIDLVDQKEKKN